MNNYLVLLIGSIWDVLKLKIISVNLKIKYSWEFYILSGSPLGTQRATGAQFLLWFPFLFPLHGVRVCRRTL